MIAPFSPVFSRAPSARSSAPGSQPPKEYAPGRCLQSDPSPQVEPPPLAELRSKADLGDSAAQLALAVCHRDGRGVERCGTEALRWAKKAADQGLSEALDFIGSLYFSGTLVERNPALAVGYFVAASDQCAQAAWNLGQCWFAAQGVPQDISRALETWELAASMGHGRAASAAAMAWLSGEGVPPEVTRALRLAQRAVELGDPAGHIVLGELYFQEGELDKARAVWARVAQMHPVRASSNPEQPSGQMSAQQGADLQRLMDLRLGHPKPRPGMQGLVTVQHVHQGWNNCGAASCAILARSQGRNVGAWQFKKLCPSPMGTGTDWNDLLKAAAKIGLYWKLSTFTPDEAGFAQATAFVRSEVDSGRAVVVDFKYTGSRYPGGEAGHTLLIVGYQAKEDLYILCNPAIATPGLQLISAADLAHYWRSDHYSHTAQGVLSRPVISALPD